MVVVQLAPITGSGKGGAIILRLGPAESDWNPFQLNVTNGYLWQLEKLHQMKSISTTETQRASKCSLKFFFVSSLPACENGARYVRWLMNELFVPLEPGDILVYLYFKVLH